ncbi:hypothetical protein BDF22DRAFT_743146 [Syncephalis plumigaleata]|nr:hypothetical protein BDF22DRAFT_743146 [Syncephalis plumigaleata]
MSPKFTLRRSMVDTHADMPTSTEARPSMAHRMSDVTDSSTVTEKSTTMRKPRRTSNLLNRFSFRGDAPTPIVTSVNRDQSEAESPSSPVLSLTMSPSLLSTLPPELMPVSEGVESIEAVLSMSGTAIENDPSTETAVTSDNDQDNQEYDYSRAARRLKRIAKLNAKASDAVKIAQHEETTTPNLQSNDMYASLSSNTSKDAASMENTEHQSMDDNHGQHHQRSGDNDSVHSKDAESVHTIVSVDDITAAVRASGLTAALHDADDMTRVKKDSASDKNVRIGNGTNTVNGRMSGISRFRNLLGGGSASAGRATNQTASRNGTGLTDLFTRGKIRRHQTMPSMDDASETNDDAIGRSAWGLGRTSKSKDRSAATATAAVAPAPTLSAPMPVQWWWRVNPPRNTV